MGSLLCLPLTRKYGLAHLHALTCPDVYIYISSCLVGCTAVNDEQCVFIKYLFIYPQKGTNKKVVHENPQTIMALLNGYYCDAHKQKINVTFEHIVQIMYF